MEEWLHVVTKDIVVIIDVMALIVVSTGTVEAFSADGGLHFLAWYTDGSARSWCATVIGSSLGSLFSSRPTSSRRRLHQIGRKSDGWEPLR